MPHSDRKQNSRLLSFESLETRKSLTTTSGAFVEPGFADTNAAQVAQDASAPATHSTSHLLLYVATLEQISIERGTPTQADANAIDQLITEASPVRLDSR